MILAAAVCGEDARQPPPAELRLAWQAITYRSLPEPGGLLDQPAGLLKRMTGAYNIWLAHKSYRQRDLRKTKEWIEANPDLYESIQQVRKLRNDAELRD